MKSSTDPTEYAIYHSVMQMDPGSFAADYTILRFASANTPPLERCRPFHLEDVSLDELGLRPFPAMAEFRTLDQRLIEYDEAKKFYSSEAQPPRVRLRALREQIFYHFSDPKVRERLTTYCAKLNEKEARRAVRNLQMADRKKRALPSAPAAGRLAEYLEVVVGEYQLWFDERGIRLSIKGLAGRSKTVSTPRDVQARLDFIDTVAKTGHPKPLLRELGANSGIGTKEWSRLLNDPRFLIQLADNLIHKINQAKTDDKRELWKEAYHFAITKFSKRKEELQRRNELPSSDGDFGVSESME